MKKHKNRISSERKHYANRLKESHFSRLQLTIFALTFAIIGGIIIYVSFAAGSDTVYIATNGADNTCVVGNPGLPCASLAKALGLLSGDGTVQFAGGTYSDPNNLTTGTGSSQVTMEGNGATIQVPIVVNWSNLTIQHFSFAPAACTYTTVCTRSGIRMGQSSAVTNDTITNNTFDGTAEPHAGVWLDYVSNNSTSQTITNNTFTRCGDPDPAQLYEFQAGNGICIDGAQTSALISHNHFSDYCYQCKHLNGQFDNSTVSGNYFGTLPHYIQPDDGYNIGCSATNTKTLLSGDIDAVTTSISVADPSGITQVGDPIMIDNEMMRVMAFRNGPGQNPLTVSRGIDGTGPGVQHSDGAPVTLNTTCVHVEHWFMSSVKDTTLSGNTFASCGPNDNLGPIQIPGEGATNGNCTSDLTVSGSNGDVGIVVENNKFIGTANNGIKIQAYNSGNMGNSFINNTCEADITPCWTIGVNGGNKQSGGYPVCGPSVPTVTCSWTIANNLALGTGDSNLNEVQRFYCYNNVEEIGTATGNCTTDNVTSSGINVDSNDDPTYSSQALIGLANKTYAPTTDFYGHTRDVSPDIGAVEYQSGPTPAPVVTLTADPTEVQSGQPTNLTWTVQNQATSCTASSSPSGVWSGSKNVLGDREASGAITANTTFTLNCAGPGGSGSDQVTVDLTSDTTPPVISIIEPPDGSQVYGYSFEVDANASDSGGSGMNYVQLTLDGSNLGPQLIGTGSTYIYFWDTSGLTNGSTHTLGAKAFDNAGNEGDAALASVTVNNPPPVVGLQANPPSVKSGQTTQLAWSATNSDSCVASGGWSGSRDPDDGNQMAETVGPLTQTSSFNLICTGPGGSDSKTITVTSPPGDINGDGIVNIIDATILTGNWGISNPCCDLNGDGTVNIIDATILTGNWGL